MNILVTGANGQLGSEIKAAAEAVAHRFVFTDIGELDITAPGDVRRLIEQERIHIIINCAAYTAVDKAEEAPEECQRINHHAPRILAEAASAAGATLIHISTDYVFSGEASRPLTETDTTQPIGVYGRTKLDGEEAIRAAGCRHIIIRTAWLYSTFGNNFVKTMRRLTSERNQINVVFDQVGAPTWARDLALFILHIITTEQYDRGGTYHFSGEGVCSWYDFAVAIAELSGSACRITPCHSGEFPTRVQRPHYSVLDKTKAKQTFGYDIPHWRTSLVACMAQLNKAYE